MAVLTLDASVPYTINYTISDMTAEYVNSAVVHLFKPGSSIPIKVESHQAIDVAHTESITGQFIGLEPDTYYVVHEHVFNALGQETSDQQSTIKTLAVDLTIDPYCKHSVIISNKNTYDEWGLIPVERPTIVPPAIKASFVEIPGTSESVDLTESLTGKIARGQSIGSWTFYFDVENWPLAQTGQLLARKLKGTLWSYVYASLMDYVHGKKHAIVLEDDPSAVYTGRLSVSAWSSGNPFSQVTINYNIDPPVRLT